VTDALVECVPNFSEGSRPEVVDEVVAAFAGADPGVLVLDRSSDADHDRTVLTLAGPGPALVEAAVAGARACARRIDLRRQGGVHPRMGALDVLPFVPLGQATSLRGGADPDLDCAALAERAGGRIATEAGIPVYLYGAAARRPERAALPAVRGRGFEALRAALAAGDAARAPDLGGPGLHPTAGATAVGARGLLIAYNVDLAGADLGLACRIAAAVRERDGGLPAVRAMGVALEGRGGPPEDRGGPGDRRGGPPEDRGGPRDHRGGPPEDRGLVQVSMNLLDYTVTPPAVAFAAVAELAERAGARVHASEIVGLVPAAALAGVDPGDLLLPPSTPDRFLEERLARALDIHAEVCQ
jgi:glutamate formiminotransferase / 5-formyltetrahydrofolate cyclo-ligase